MPGPAPTYQPTFTPEQLAACQRVIRQHSAPQAQVYRARLALLLHDDPARDNVSAGRQLGKHENWVRYWRRLWATEGFRLTDKPGRGRKPTFPPPCRWRRSRRWPANCRRGVTSRSAAIARPTWHAWSVSSPTPRR